ncbi:MAG: hypothetical protein IK088_06050 [Lachnospiraceae bacterium]|nr:hypothetical protein [Lachnospiraceae bacterium]
MKTNPNKKASVIVILMILMVFLFLAFLNAVTENDVRAAVEMGIETAGHQIIPE